MNNCQVSNDVAPDETPDPFDTEVSRAARLVANPPDGDRINATLDWIASQLPDRQRWPETRRACVLWTQEHLDRELARLPRRVWFDRALRICIADPLIIPPDCPSCGEVGRIASAIAHTYTCDACGSVWQTRPKCDECGSHIGHGSNCSRWVAK